MIPKVRRAITTRLADMVKGGILMLKKQGGESKYVWRSDADRFVGAPAPVKDWSVAAGRRLRDAKRGVTSGDTSSRRKKSSKEKSGREKSSPKHTRKPSSTRKRTPNYTPQHATTVESNIDNFGMHQTVTFLPPSMARFSTEDSDGGARLSRWGSSSDDDSDSGSACSFEDADSEDSEGDDFDDELDLDDDEADDSGIGLESPQVETPPVLPTQEHHHVHEHKHKHSHTHTRGPTPAPFTPIFTHRQPSPPISNCSITPSQSGSTVARPNHVSIRAEISGKSLSDLELLLTELLARLIDMKRVQMLAGIACNAANIGFVTEVTTRIDRSLEAAWVVQGVIDEKRGVREARDQSGFWWWFRV